jgi:hypothetical protein
MFRVDVKDNEIGDLARDDPDIRIWPMAEPLGNVALRGAFVLEMLPKDEGALVMLTQR